MDHYMIVGNWNFKLCEKGLQVYRYREDFTELELVETTLTDVTVGQQFFDPEKSILYITHESNVQRGGQGAGGSVLALRADLRTGGLTLISERPSLGTKPSYVWKDAAGNYLVVAHHAGRNGVTKIERNVQGQFQAKNYFDDTTLVLFRLNQDGGIAEACDALYYSGTNEPGLHALSHLHSVTANSDGSLYVVCDKGQDRIYALRIDREKGKLVQTGSAVAEDGSAPRYAVFHPTLPVVYINHEEKTYLSAYRYGQSGELELLDQAPLLDESRSSHDTPSDLAIASDGRTLYASIRGADQIAVLHLDGEGRMARIQNIDCGGKTPRGIEITPDGKYLLSANQDSGLVSKLRIHSDGTLSEAQDLLQASCPGSIAFMRMPKEEEP